MTHYAFIGDIHSHADNLHTLLKKIYAAGNYQLVFLGDIFDYSASKTRFSNPKEVWRTISSLSDPVVLNSNHQQGLLKYLKGGDYRVRNSALIDTITKLGLTDIDCDWAVKLRYWLATRPHFYEVTAGDTDYRLAHAFYSSRLSNFSTEGLNKKEKQYCLYGPVVHLENQKSPTRVRWWLNKADENQTFIRVAGHYHTVYSSRYSLILDGSSGSCDDGHLVAYLTDQREIISTAPSLIKREIALGHYEYAVGERPAPRFVPTLATCPGR